MRQRSTTHCLHTVTCLFVAENFATNALKDCLSQCDCLVKSPARWSTYTVQHVQGGYVFSFFFDTPLRWMRCMLHKVGKALLVSQSVRGCRDTSTHVLVSLFDDAACAEILTATEPHMNQTLTAPPINQRH
jgi:hypothetical protein